MGKESIVTIKGGKYRYEYDPETQKTLYLGPVGDAPEIGEKDFMRCLTDFESEKEKLFRKMIKDDMSIARQTLPVSEVGEMYYWAEDVMKDDPGFDSVVKELADNHVRLGHTGFWEEEFLGGPYEFFNLEDPTFGGRDYNRYQLSDKIAKEHGLNFEADQRHDRYGLPIQVWMLRKEDLGTMNNPLGIVRSSKKFYFGESPSDDPDDYDLVEGYHQSWNSSPLASDSFLTKIGLHPWRRRELRGKIIAENDEFLMLAQDHRYFMQQSKEYINHKTLKPYPTCPVCGRQLSTERGLSIHMSKRH